MTNRSWSGQIAESLFAVLFSSDCRICGTALVRISRLPVCQECIDDAMCPITGGVCTLCGERLVSPYAIAGASGESLCGRCRRTAPLFARAASYGSYESGLRELIHLLKFGGVRPAANVLGRMLVEAIAALATEFPADSVIVPVPLHRAQLHQRGFNQAELIARAALKISPSRDRLHLCTEALDRRRETASQIGLTGQQRRENLRGAFGVARPELVKGREVLLVDDVYTTGATVSECARVLHRAGAAKIWVATVARTLKISAQHVEIGPCADDIPMDERIGKSAAPLAKAVGV